MSAFIVEDDLIDLLVTYAREHHLTTQDGQSLGSMLVAQNTHSVNHRYRENDAPEAYTFTEYTGPMDPIAVFKGAGCYDYQACETDDYKDLPAARLVAEIRDHAANAFIYRTPAYDKAPWGAAPNPKRRGVKCGTPVLLSKIGRSK